MELSRQLDATPGNYSGKARTELDADRTGPSDPVMSAGEIAANRFDPVTSLALGFSIRQIGEGHDGSKSLRAASYRV